MFVFVREYCETNMIIDWFIFFIYFIKWANLHCFTTLQVLYSLCKYIYLLIFIIVNLWIFIKFIYNFILFLFLFGFGNNRNGMGYCGNDGYVTTSQFESENNFRTLDNSNRMTQNGLCQLGYEQANLINASTAQIVGNITGEGRALQSQIADCCCTTQRAIDSLKLENCQNTQKILDVIQGNRIAEMQSQISQLPELQRHHGKGKEDPAQPGTLRSGPLSYGLHMECRKQSFLRLRMRMQRTLRIRSRLWQANFSARIQSPLQQGRPSLFRYRGCAVATWSLTTTP